MNEQQQNQEEARNLRKADRRMGFATFMGAAQAILGPAAQVISLEDLIDEQAPHDSSERFGRAQSAQAPTAATKTLTNGEMLAFDSGCQCDFCRAFKADGIIVLPEMPENQFAHIIIRHNSWIITEAVKKFGEHFRTHHCGDPDCRIERILEIKRRFTYQEQWYHQEVEEAVKQPLPPVSMESRTDFSNSVSAIDCPHLSDLILVIDDNGDFFVDDGEIQLWFGATDEILKTIELELCVKRLFRSLLVLGMRLQNLGEISPERPVIVFNRKLRKVIQSHQTTKTSFQCSCAGADELFITYLPVALQFEEDIRPPIPVITYMGKEYTDVGQIIKLFINDNGETPLLNCPHGFHRALDLAQL